MVLVVVIVVMLLMAVVMVYTVKSEWKGKSEQKLNFSCDVKVVSPLPNNHPLDGQLHHQLHHHCQHHRYIHHHHGPNHHQYQADAQVKDMADWSPVWTSWRQPTSQKL